MQRNQELDLDLDLETELHLLRRQLPVEQQYELLREQINEKESDIAWATLRGIIILIVVNLILLSFTALPLIQKYQLSQNHNKPTEKVSVLPTEKVRLQSNDTTQSKRVKAFLDTIAWAETGEMGLNSYRALVFNGHFNSFASHPMQLQCADINGKNTCSYAAGRYQIMNYEWDKYKPSLHLPDFSPTSQDKIAIEMIRRKGALNDVKNGNFEVAACKVGGEWASFPCNGYGQNPRSMTALKKIYEKQLKKHENT